MKIKGTAQDLLVGAALARGPLPEGSFGEICAAISGSAITLKIPDWAKGYIVEFTADTASADVCESAATAAASVTAAIYNQTSTVDGSTKAITTSAASGRHVVAGTTRKWLVSPNANYWSIIGSGAGFITIAVVSQQIANNS